MRTLYVLALLTLLAACGAPTVANPFGFSLGGSTTRSAPSTGAPATTPVPLSSLKAYPAVAHVTGIYPPSCHAVGNRPDPTCTPGSVQAGATKDSVCSSKTADIRPPEPETRPVKTRAMRAYGVPASVRATTELDHLVPLALGGSNDVSNLWPEASDLPGNTFRNSKDDVEVKLAAGVCAGKVLLVVAQNAIASDWTTALAKTKLG